jgi:hypothetical protein
MKSSSRKLLIGGMALALSACQSTKPTEAPEGIQKGEAISVPRVGSEASKPSSSSSKSVSEAVKPGASSSPPAPSGNATQAKAVEAAPASPTIQKTKPEQLLAEGTELYDKGDYKGAIRKLLLARDSADEASATKQDSLRLLAFSYCVTGQRPLCKTQFGSLLKIAPDFQLSRAEAGHPLWGPVFKEAKAAGTPAPKPATAAKVVKKS